MALISSESMTLIVNGTLQSEFFTMFWPTRLTYSTTCGSEINLVLFSISIEYILPILISVSVEYQLPMPRPPISRFPTELTSSTLPGLTLIFWLPGSTTFSGLAVAVEAGAAMSPPTGVVPGAGFLSVVEGCLSPGAGCLASGAGCLASGLAGVSPPTGVVPGAGWAVGESAGGVVLDGVDWAHAVEASTRTNPAIFTALEPLKTDLMTEPPPAKTTLKGFCRFALLIRR